MRLIKKFEKGNPIKKEENVSSINNPIIWDQMYDEKKDGDLFSDYEKVGGMWFNKNQSSKYLTDAEMIAKRVAQVRNYSRMLSIVRDARKTIDQIQQAYTESIEDNEAIRKQHELEAALNQALEAGKQASKDYYNTQLKMRMEDTDDDVEPYIKDWKDSNNAYAQAAIKYLQDYETAHPQTDGSKLFDQEEVAKYFQELVDTQNQSIDQGVNLSKTVPATALGLLYGGSTALRGYSALKSALLSKASPDVLAGLHGLNSAANGYLGIESAKYALGKDGLQKTYNLIKQGDYTGAFTSGAGDLANAAFIFGTKNIPGIPRRLQTNSLFKNALTEGRRAFNYGYYPRALAREGIRRFGTAEGTVNALNGVNMPGLNVGNATRSWRDWGNEITKLSDKLKYEGNLPSLSMPIMVGGEILLSDENAE